uniref:CSON010913 protein n=2 Tax=Culicoides sonorensis TaxID=179676 RepID=A0A336M2S9_CULSO
MKIETMLGRRNTISSSSSGKFWPFSFKSSSFGSTVAIQKLRETKWFGEDEERIFCSVVESGFIVEVHDENRENTWYGIVDFNVKKDKKPTAADINVYSIKMRDGKPMKVVKMTIVNIWKQGNKIRINNFGDKDSTPHSEKDIRSQILFAAKSRTMTWHNSQHFAHWCRYGSKQQDIRKREMSECLKYGSLGLNAGILLVMNNQQRQRSMTK